MKAMVYTSYGPPDVLRLQEVEMPAPKDDEVLIRVHAASINYPDWGLLRGKPFLVRAMAGGLLRPKNTILGADVAGRVEAVGAKVSRFRPGDAVFGDLSAARFGGFAEYVCAPEHLLAAKPANVSFEAAAAVPMAGVVALQGLRLGEIKAGQEVLVVGASGGNGGFAVQIAKALGAEVTGVCSTCNLELVRSLGADRTIDYTKEDFAANGQRYDLILATAGYRPLWEYRRALRPSGIYVVTGGKMAQIFQPMVLGPFLPKGEGQKLLNLSAQPDCEDLAAVGELVEAGQVVPAIDRCYPLSEAAQALAYYGEGHARGKVVITITSTDGGE
jgi:NADPH:quinone reductase-like Zn-dependent oxidoreductase